MIQNMKARAKNYTLDATALEALESLEREFPDHTRQAIISGCVRWVAGANEITRQLAVLGVSHELIAKIRSLADTSLLNERQSVQPAADEPQPSRRPRR